MNSLFDNETETHKPAPVPAWVVRELVGKWKVPERTARGFNFRQAFAVLYRYRERSIENSPQAIRRRQLDIAQRLAALSRDENSNPEIVIGMIQEGLSTLDAGPLSALAEELARLLRLPATHAT